MKATEERCVAFLRARPGTYFCAGCLALELGLSLQDTQEAVTALRRFKDFDMRAATCSSCSQAIAVVCAIAAREYPDRR